MNAFHRSLIFGAAILTATLALCVKARGAATPAEGTADYVRVEGVADDRLSLDVAVGPAKDCKFLHLVVKDTIVKERLGQLHKGDRIKVIYSSDPTGSSALKIFCVDTASPGPGAYTRAWVLLACAAICLLLSPLLSGTAPWKFVIGADNRYSNSKFQIALWFLVVITSYIATVWLRVWYAGWDFIGGVNIPQNLLMLSGMSAVTFAGAAGITAQKVETAKANGIADPKNIAAASPSFFLDLTTNDGAAANGGKAVPRQLDFGDFQMLVVTLIAVATYLVLVFNFLGTIEVTRLVTLPDVDTSILAAFGLGHGAYLAKKAVGNVGQS